MLSQGWSLLGGVDEVWGFLIYLCNYWKPALPPVFVSWHFWCVYVCVIEEHGDLDVFLYYNESFHVWDILVTQSKSFCVWVFVFVSELCYQCRPDDTSS